MLTEEENFGSLARVNRELIGKAEALDSPQRVVSDMDSTEIPMYGCLPPSFDLLVCAPPLLSGRSGQPRRQRHIRPRHEAHDRPGLCGVGVLHLAAPNGLMRRRCVSGAKSFLCALVKSTRLSALSPATRFAVTGRQLSPFSGVARLKHVVDTPGP